MPMEGSSPPTGRSMTGRSTAFSSLHGCHRKCSKPERSGWRDASTPFARSLVGSQIRAPASGGIFLGISATCWRTFRTLGRPGIRASPHQSDDDRDAHYFADVEMRNGYLIGESVSTRIVDDITITLIVRHQALP